MYPIHTENDRFLCSEVYAPLPDGTRLYTRLIRPRGVDTCPCVVIRTPYEPARRGVPYDLSSCGSDPFLSRGFALAIQHCRGCGDSEGAFKPYREEEDGLALLAFLRDQAFYNGEFYLHGGSYLATVHLCYMARLPEDVKGISLQIQTDRMYHRNYRCGCNYQWNNLIWWSMVLKRRFPDHTLSLPLKRPYISAAEEVFGQPLPEYTDGLLHDTPDSYWTDDPRWEAITHLSVPILLVDGWYDYYLGGMMDMWTRLPAQTRARSAMIVGPYGHGTAVSGDAEYPLTNGNIPSDYSAAWFDSLRSGTSYPYAPLGRLTYYSIGSSVWRHGVYPPAGGERQMLFLAPSGRLSTEPSDAAPISYRYDPLHIHNCYRFGSAYRAHAPHSLDGILSFIGPEAEREQSYFGSLRVRLTVSSSCADTAFFARIYLVEEGESYNLTEAVGALSYFTDCYEPGSEITLELDTTPIAFTLKKGCALRLDVSSESGVYLPHPNVKGHFALVDHTEVAKNTLYPAKCCLILPLCEQA